MRSMISQGDHVHKGRRIRCACSEQMARLTDRKRKRYAGKGIVIADRPWSALSPHYRELRLDTVAWHEREIFLEKILKHPAKIVRHRAETTTAEQMKLMIRAWK